MTAMMADLLGDAAVRRLRRVESSALYDDDSEWLELVIAEYATSEERFLECVDAKVEHWRVRTFHGTRTADASSFEAEGIRLHQRVQLEANVRQLVAQSETLAWLEAKLDQKFADRAHLIDEGRCFVVVDERVLVEECGHYLLGGSEFIQGIIGPQEAQRVFQGCAPTVIEVDLPLLQVRPSLVREFSRTLVGEWAKILRRNRDQPRHLDFSFSLTEPLPATWIAGHFHPAVVHDPHAGRRPIRSKHTTCAACHE